MWKSPRELAHVPLPAEFLIATEEDDPTEQYVQSAFGRGCDGPDDDVEGETSPVLRTSNGASNMTPMTLAPRSTRAAASAAANYFSKSCRQCCTRQAWYNLAYRRVPALTWLPSYSPSMLRNDLVAGITVGVVLIPQGVAYAMLAELPPIYGLYASLLPLPIYATMCTSRHMSIGPFALVSLLVADSVSEVVPPESEGYVGAVMLLSLMIGVFHCLMAAMNMGIIVRLISDSVLAGFTSAAAILISASQLKHLLGMPIPRAPLLDTLYFVATHLSQINPLAVTVGILGIGLLQLFKDLNKGLCKRVPLPEQLLLLALATLVTWLLGLEEQDAPSSLVSAAANASAAFSASDLPPPPRRFSLPVVGDVPSGLPHLAPPPISFDLVFDMLQPAIVVGIFSFILSMSIVRTFALKYDYVTDSNQELLALGLANIAGAFFLSYPVAGSLSRSALVASGSGPDCTPLHGLVTSLLVLVVLLVLTPTFRPMPRACLASIVFMAVKSLFDTSKARYLYRLKTTGARHELRAGPKHTRTHALRTHTHTHTH